MLAENGFYMADLSPQLHFQSAKMEPKRHATTFTLYNSLMKLDHVLYKSTLVDTQWVTIVILVKN